MNDMRDMLIELIQDIKLCNPTNWDKPEFMALALLADGVVLPPCNVGDTVYKCHTVNLNPTGEITKRTIKQITFSAFTVTDDGASGWFDIDDIGKTVFLTREDAEKSLREREGE